VTDMNMPEMDGFALVEQMRNNPELSAVTVMMLTSASHRGDVERCRQLGIRSYLFKPVRKRELLAAILAALGQSSAVSSSAAIIRPERPVQAQGLRILLAEDNRVNQIVATRMAEKMGNSVVVAGNGERALLLLATQPFDLVLMDVQMPEMDGIEATHHIRSLADPVKANIPIIALTANALKGDSEKYLAAGMTDYLAKPFDEERLFRVISRNLLPSTTTLSNDNDSRTNSTQKNNHNNMSSGNERLYDLTMVQSVSGGDEGFIRKMVALFIETVPQNMQDLKNALEATNWEQVGKTAHKLKSTIDSMGIKSIRQEIRTVESNAKQLESLEEIPALVAMIDNVIKECIDQLQAEVLN